MLHELIYTSRATTSMEPNDLTALLKQSREKNARLNITGILVFHKGEFIQLLEGDKSAIFSLYETICKDDRNNKNELLWQSEIKERSFTDWSMAFLNIQDIDEKQLESYSTFLQDGTSSLHLTGNNSMGRRLLISLRELLL